MGFYDIARASFVIAATFAVAGPALSQDYSNKPVRIVVVAPAGTPKRVLNKLNQEIARAVDLPDLKEKLATQDAQPMTMTPEEFDALIRSEVAKLGKLLKASGPARVERRRTAVSTRWG